MKNFERAHTMKGFVSPETLKRVNFNGSPLMFFSAPSSTHGTPTTTPDRRKLKLDPLTKDIFLTKKPTIHSLSSESPPLMKATQIIISDLNKKSAQLTKDIFDSDSETHRLSKNNGILSLPYNYSITAIALKSHRRSRFASSSSVEPKILVENSPTSRVPNPNENSKESSVNTESKQPSVKASESILKARDSPFQRKGFRLMTNPAISDYNSDNEIKKSRISKVETVVPYRSLYFSPNFNYEKFKKHLIMVHKGLVYSTQSLKSPSEKFVASKQVAIPDPPISKLL